MNKLKIKTIKEKPRKILAINVEEPGHLQELSVFLLGLPDKKFDVILNGKLVKFNSSVARNNFVDGFDAASRILMAEYAKVSVEIKVERQNLLNQIAALKRMYGSTGQVEEKLKANEMAMEIRIASWKDRIAELENDCVALKTKLTERTNEK